MLLINGQERPVGFFLGGGGYSYVTSHLRLKSSSYGV